jgi:hypothetical protein
LIKTHKTRRDDKINNETNENERLDQNVWEARRVQIQQEYSLTTLPAEMYNVTICHTRNLVYINVESLSTGAQIMNDDIAVCDTRTGFLSRMSKLQNMRRFDIREQTETHALPMTSRISEFSNIMALRTRTEYIFSSMTTPSAPSVPFCKKEREGSDPRILNLLARRNVFLASCWCSFIHVEGTVRNKKRLDVQWKLSECDDKQHEHDTSSFTSRRNLLLPSSG